MRKLKTKEELYKSCSAEGYFRNIAYVNKERVKSLLANASINIDSAMTLAKSLPKDDRRWMTVYTLHYEAVRICAEALIIFDKIMSENHQCLFAYLCVKYSPEFEWDFLEQIRRKRNGVNYYGEQISYGEWKSAEVKFNACISKLWKEIEKKLRQ